MPAPHELDPSASPLALLGSELRKYRLAANLSQEQLGEMINFSTGMISFIERAERAPRREFVELCEKALGLDGELLRLWPLITMESSPQWFRPWLQIEPDARTLRTWQPLLIPGLLQTEEYARAILSGEPGMKPEQIEEAVAARMHRQTIFERSTPPMFWVVLDEGVLSRPVGSGEVMHNQLKHLIDMAGHPFVTIQLAPLDSRATCGLEGGFVIAQLAGQADTVFLESATLGYVTNRPEEVSAVTVRYEAIRAEALPATLSMKLINEKMVNTWT
ncbi:helix-turn-helix transcriptional regulator [Acrocarpospora sp. B8E8]|uniref:helix-turn-helix domain-containing protein n=1 Tax=Acrocarpospora sp. B8E8 TaxID=3153572 RepID=UPI00325E7D45